MSARHGVRRRLDRIRGRTPDADTAAWLASRPWEQRELPPRLLDVPSMLTYEERELLRTLAEQHPLRRGCIVDAGCFLGGSTLAFALGLRAREGRLPAVHTYDRFVLDWASLGTYPQWLEGLAAGDRFRDRFDAVVGEELELVTVHEGDILGMRWAGDPIEILFIDIAKSWEIGDHVHREWLPSLVAGSGVLVQQDYVHEWCPWLHVLMELLADHFESVATVGSISQVYRCRSAVPAAAIPADLRALGADTLLDLFARSAERFAGEDRAVVECARAVLLAAVGRREDAAAHLASVAERSAGAGPRMPSVLAGVGAYVND
jgi:hypothetical protein